MLKRILLLTGVGLSLFLLWFAVSNYRDARPIAEENLRGLALSLTVALENIAVRDPSLRSLSQMHTRDIAFISLVDRNGLYRFHTNTDLIGTHTQSPKPLDAIRNESISEERVTLGTGETAYEFDAPIHLSGETLGLQLTLHTYRADAVVRRAELNMMILLSLLVVGWILAFVLYRYARREEQHQLEMARRESLAQLGEMGAMLAHEIRNPLAGIKGYAQIIVKKPQEARNSDFARRIVAEVLRLENLVSDLLAYARSNSLPVSLVNLTELVYHTVSLIRHEAEQQQVALVTDCPEGLQIPGNRDRLGQVLLNLGKNALQAMPDGGVLTITSAVSGSDVLLTMSDTGHGMGRDVLARIFEPFFTTKARGTGLGLALSKKIIEEHGGEISVESTAGQGTSVSITLPAQRREHI